MWENRRGAILLLLLFKVIVPEIPTPPDNISWGSSAHYVEYRLFLSAPHGCRVASLAAGVAEKQNPQWWRKVQDVADAAAVRDGWRHPRRGWARLAEDALCEWCGGVDWSDQAADRSSWRAGRDAFVEWCAVRYVADSALVPRSGRAPL